MTKFEGTTISDKTYREMIQYHNGYILALEDIKSDMERFIRAGTYTGERMRAQIQGTLADAKRSREALIKINDEVAHVG